MITVSGNMPISTGDCSVSEYAITAADVAKPVDIKAGSTCKVESSTKVTITLAAGSTLNVGDKIRFKNPTSTHASLVGKSLDNVNDKVSIQGEFCKLRPVMYNMSIMYLLLIGI